MANKHMKIFSTSLTIIEVQNKTTVKYHLRAIRMTITKKKERENNKY